MKRILPLFLFLSLTAVSGFAQPFWVENFGTTGTSVSGTVVSSYGGWTLTVTGSEGTSFNQWYVSCEEAGHTTGGCGSVCGSTPDIGPTLHLGSTVLGDMGASYYVGPIPNATTDRRANSPTINCTGRYGITMSFYYTEDGDLTSDDATIWYSPDNGTTWTLLDNPPKTPAICPGGQGYWDHRTVSLPTSANNNPTVKIGFRWVNNNDGAGTDPSFAVDSIGLWGSTSTTTTSSFTTSTGTVCQDSCVTFTSTSTGTIDSFTWSISPAAPISTPHASPVTVCFSVAGTYTMTLTTYNSGTPHTSTHTVTVNPAPAAITGSHSVCVSYTDPLSCTTAGGTWSSSTPSVATVGSTTGIVTGVSAGTTTITYTITATGCIAIYSVTVTPLPCTTGLDKTGLENRFWITQPTGNTIDLYASAGLSETVTISVYDPTGRQISREEWEQNKNMKQVDCSHCAPGLYIIRLTGKNTSEVLKWLKQ